MKISRRLLVAVGAALVCAGPAFAQWPPPPPPFVTNPAVNPPMAQPQAKAAAQQRDLIAKQSRQARRDHERAVKAARQAHANACHREADSRKLRGKERRRFVAYCRAH
jgi:hypothetical protein